MKTVATVNLTEERISKLIEDDGKIIGSIDISYPQVQWEDIVTEQYVNGVYRTIANNVHRHTMARIQPKGLKKLGKKSSKELLIAESKYHNTLNKGGIISGYNDDSLSKLSSGVEHMVRVAVSFDLLKGKHIWLSTLFKSFSGYKKRIIKAILLIIQENKGKIEYKDNIAELVELNLYNGNFYLTEKNIVVFYQPGEICDDKGFIPSFSISKQSLQDILK